MRLSAELTGTIADKNLWNSLLYDTAGPIWIGPSETLFRLNTVPVLAVGSASTFPKVRAGT
jgi:hypothetical protein